MSIYMNICRFSNGCCVSPLKYCVRAGCVSRKYHRPHHQLTITRRSGVCSPLCSTHVAAALIRSIYLYPASWVELNWRTSRAPWPGFIILYNLFILSNTYIHTVSPLLSRTQLSYIFITNEDSVTDLYCTEL